MANLIYGFTALTGGAADALDYIDGDVLVDKDVAIGSVGGVYYTYYLDDDSGAAEASPSVISPATNAGTKRWVLCRVNANDTGVYYSSDYASLAAFVTAIGSTECTLVINRDEAVATSTVIPETVAVEVLNGCVITIATDHKTLTVNGSLSAGNYQVFSCTGTGAVAGLKEARPEWFGVNTTPGTTDMTTAISKAIGSMTGGVLRLKDNSTYLITAEIIGHDNLEIAGNNATITAETRIQSFLYFSSKTNIHVHDTKFDMGMSHLAVYSEGDDYDDIWNAGLYFNACSDITVERCQFTELYTRSIMTYACTGRLTITNNKFTSPAQTQTSMLEHVYIGSFDGIINIEHNNFDNAEPADHYTGVCAITGYNTAGAFNVQRNKLNYCGREMLAPPGICHQLGAIDFYNSHENVTVKDNIVTNCLDQFIRLSACTHGEISGNLITCSSKVGTGAILLSVEGFGFAPAADVPSTDINIHHNRFVGYLSAGDPVAYGIGVWAYDYVAPSKNIKIHHNDFHDISYPINVGGPFDGIMIDNNTVSGAGNGKLRVMFHVPGDTGIPASNHGVAEADSFYKNLFIRENILALTAPGPNIAISVDLTKTGGAYTGDVGNIEIAGNTIHPIAQGTGIAIYVKVAASTHTERVMVRDNYINNHVTGLYLIDSGEVVSQGNRIVGSTNAYVQSGNLSFSSAGNKWGYGALSGTAVLVAGTSTVSNTEVVASDTIILTRILLGGTAGHLSIGTITAGTSFVINSSSNSDTSTIYWKIDH